MRRLFLFQALLALAVFAAGVRPGQAEPLLQLDIEGGVYDNSTETLVATGPVFTLYALLTPGGGDTIADLLNDFYYISALLTPKTGEPGGIFGWFEFDGATDADGNDLGGGVDAVDNPYLVTGDMTYGSPPIDACELDPESCGGDPGDIGGHDIFETYFIEFEFQLTDLLQTATHNTETDGGGFRGLVPDGNRSYLIAFQVDLTDLYTDYFIHFDLYSTELSKKSDAEPEPRPRRSTSSLLEEERRRRQHQEIRAVFS